MLRQGQKVNQLRFELQVMKAQVVKADTECHLPPQAAHEEASMMKHPEMQLPSRRLSAEAYLQVASVVGMITHCCLAHADAVFDQVGLVAIQLIVKGLMLLFSLQLLLGQACAAEGTNHAGYQEDPFLDWLGDQLRWLRALQQVSCQISRGTLPC